jgi:hypothetical protein
VNPGEKKRQQTLNSMPSGKNVLENVAEHHVFARRPNPQPFKASTSLSNAALIASGTPLPHKQLHKLGEDQMWHVTKCTAFWQLLKRE